MSFHSFEKYLFCNDTYNFCTDVTIKVSETEREDLEESEKVQHWVERLCQTRLEQISSVENESPEVMLWLLHIAQSLTYSFSPKSSNVLPQKNLFLSAFILVGKKKTSLIDELKS